MRNIYIYYTAFLAPAALLAAFWNVLPSQAGLFLLAIYVFVYRTWLDGTRLNGKGLIEKKDIWKVAVNGSRGKFFKELYLQK